MIIGISTIANETRWTGGDGLIGLLLWVVSMGTKKRWNLVLVKALWEWRYSEKRRHTLSSEVQMPGNRPIINGAPAAVDGNGVGQ